MVLKTEISGFLESPENSIFTHIVPLKAFSSAYESSRKSQRLNLWAVNYESPSPTNITKQHVLKRGQHDNAETKHQPKESELFLLNPSEKEFSSCLDCLRHCGELKIALCITKPLGISSISTLTCSQLMVAN